MKVLILGASGLLGNMVFRSLSESVDLEVYGTVRSEHVCDLFLDNLRGHLIVVKDLTLLQDLRELLEKVRPSIVINCISVGRPIPGALEFLLPLLSVLPQRLLYLCSYMGIRLVQISSDGIFSGQKGGYTEKDIPDAEDAYGIAKLLGEVEGRAVTVRTSLLGPELEAKSGLLEWFLSQPGECKGYLESIFSGVTTLELAKCLKDFIIPNQDLSGVFHVVGPSCSKFELLKMIKSEYGAVVSIVPDNSLRVDRSLSGEKLKKVTGYSAPGWVEMLHAMRNYKFGLKVGI